MSYNSELQQNNAELEEILASVNALPNAGGGSDGVVVARFSSQNWSSIYCDSHTAREIRSHLEQGRCPVLAHITMEPQGGTICYLTALCHVEGEQTVVYDAYSGYMWASSGDSSFFGEF